MNIIESLPGESKARRCRVACLWLPIDSGEEAWKLGPGAAEQRRRGPLTKPGPACWGLGVLLRGAKNPCDKGRLFPVVCFRSNFNLIQRPNSSPVSINVGSRSSWPDEHNLAFLCRSLDILLLHHAPLTLAKLDPNHLFQRPSPSPYPGIRPICMSATAEPIPHASRRQETDHHGANRGPAVRPRAANTDLR